MYPFSSLIAMLGHEMTCTIPRANVNHGWVPLPNTFGRDLMVLKLIIPNVYAEIPSNPRYNPG